MKIELTNKIALITGGATGIGKGMAKALYEANAQVIVTSRSKEDLNK